MTKVKNQNFQATKKVEISTFELQKCYIPQKYAENMYNKDSAKSKISYTKLDLFSNFHLMLEDS